MHRELVVLSHLRWVWVWQRPQHLVSRVGRGMDRVWFVEEPGPADVETTGLRVQREGQVERVWLEVPDLGRHPTFEPPYSDDYARELATALGPRVGERVVWLYTPLALDIAHRLDPSVVVYDVMDDLAAFKDAAPALVQAQRRALAEADVVFAGGRSLHRGVVDLGRSDARLFPSGVEPEHYAAARHLRVRGPRPVAGYVGVIDERIDLDLVAGLAEALPEWEIRMVGPVTKIDARSIPQLDNLTLPGAVSYDELPSVMARFDVALMPFARNEATRSISPTKTLEYLAAGLPVVSTPIADVVSDYGEVVDIQPDAAGFATACRRVLEHDLADRDRKLQPLLDRHHWDRIAAEMSTIVAEASAAPVVELTA